MMERPRAGRSLMRVSRMMKTEYLKSGRVRSRPHEERIIAVTEAKVEQS